MLQHGMGLPVLVIQLVSAAGQMAMVNTPSVIGDLNNCSRSRPQGPGAQLPQNVGWLATPVLIEKLVAAHVGVANSCLMLRALRLLVNCPAASEALL